MSEVPRFTSADLDRILRRAAEIEGSGVRGLSVEDLRAIAGEVGYQRGTVDRALAEMKDAARAAREPAPVQKWGLVITHLTALREVPVAMTADQLTRVVRLFHPYREGPAEVKLEELEITWRDGRGLRFALSSSSGVTHIRVFVSKFLLRTGRWMGWVKVAADRLETLTVLVGREEERPRPESLRIQDRTP